MPQRDKPTHPGELGHCNACSTRWEEEHREWEQSQFPARPSCHKGRNPLHLGPGATSMRDCNYRPGLLWKRTFEGTPAAARQHLATGLFCLGSRRRWDFQGLTPPPAVRRPAACHCAQPQALGTCPSEGTLPSPGQASLAPLHPRRTTREQVPETRPVVQVAINQDASAVSFMRLQASQLPRGHPPAITNAKWQ